MTGFRRLSARRVFAGHLFSVDVVLLEDPDGAEFEREVLEHPGAVSVVPADEDGTVTLVRQVRPAVAEAVLEAPAGTCDVDGESAEEAARRELAEEAGLRAERLERLGTVFNSPGYSSQRSVIFLATGLSGCETGPSGAEERWMSTELVHLEDVERLVAEGRLMDATTIAGLLLARSRLPRGPS
jgi:8-oxo-dGTP pyrophosphatase MutT (NUDIX family)